MKPIVRRLLSPAVARAAVGLVAVAAVAELVSATRLVDPQLVPSVFTVLRRFGELAVDPEFLGGVGTTLMAWLLGLVCAIVVAVPVGVLLGALPGVNAAARILVEFLRPIPSVALIPLAIILFGGGTTMTGSLVFYASLWPILINTVYALQDVDPMAKDTLRAFGFGPLALLWRVALPSAAPFVATGVRLAASIGIVVVISAELLSGGNSGIGVFLLKSQTAAGHTDVILAGALWAGVIGLVINALLVRAERSAFAWFHKQTAES